MNQSHRLDPEPTGVSTVDLLLLTAGFACGWVMLAYIAQVRRVFRRFRRVDRAFSAVCGSENDARACSEDLMA